MYSESLVQKQQAMRDRQAGTYLLARRVIGCMLDSVRAERRTERIAQKQLKRLEREEAERYEKAKQWKLLEALQKKAASLGQRHPVEYCAFHGAKQRCTNPRNKNFYLYGGRGIKFLFTSFEQFFYELGRCPKGRSLDRRNNNGNYEPGNVRWATFKQQAKNRRPQSPYQRSAAHVEALKLNMVKARAALASKREAAAAARRMHGN